MASPAAYDNTGYGLRGSPQLFGDMAGLRCVPTSTLRRRIPTESGIHRMHVYLVVAACHDANLSAKIVAESLGITERHVRRLYAKKAKAQGRFHT